MLLSEQQPSSLTVTPSLVSLATTPRHRRIALAVAIGMLLMGGLTLPVAQVAGPSSTVFLPTWVTLAVAADAMTAYLFFGQFMGARQPALAVLAGTYLFSSLIIVPYVLTFPHVFAAGGLLDAGPQTAIWLWVCWHGGYPLGLLTYLWVDKHFEDVRLSARGAIMLTALLCLLIPTTILLLTLGAIVGGHVLPTLVMNGQYTPLFSIASLVGVCTWGVGIVTGLGLLLRARGATLAQLWLSLATLAGVLDVLLTMISGSRDSIGWYMARLNSLLEAGIVLCALLYEVNQLYARLADQERTAQFVNGQLTVSNATLDKLAREDVLTGLPNRRTILEVTAMQLAQYRRHGDTFALLMVDVDNFKTYNDRLGHQEGDRVLRLVAQTLRGALRATDQIGRYGGEEFVIVLNQATATGITATARHLLQAVRQEPLQIEELCLPITVSIGAALARPSDETIDAIVQRADAALYAAKAAGKDRVVSATSDSADSLSGLHTLNYEGRRGITDEPGRHR